MRDIKVIDGENYFNKKSLADACGALEIGETIKIYIDCIGHTRNNNEQEVYKEALEEIYGSRLIKKASGSGYSYSYLYQLDRRI